MLLVPSDAFRNFAFLGVDPGLSETGVSIFRMIDFQLASIEALTLVNAKLRSETCLDEESHTERQIKMRRLGQAFQGILQQELPILVACESPFFNSRMPGAFGSLTETVTVLRYETQLYSPVVPFVSYSPQEVKQTFKQSGKLGKLVMKEALMGSEVIMSKLITPVETLDEHGIDAVAVGSTWLSRYMSWRP